MLGNTHRLIFGDGWDNFGLQKSDHAIIQLPKSSHANLHTNCQPLLPISAFSKQRLELSVGNFDIISPESLLQTMIDLFIWLYGGFARDDEEITICHENAINTHRQLDWLRHNASTHP